MYITAEARISQKQPITQKSSHFKVKKLTIFLIYVLTITFVSIVFGVTIGINMEEYYGKVLAYENGGNFLCWFHGISWYVSYFGVYVITVIICIISTIISLLILNKNKSGSGSRPGSSSKNDGKHTSSTQYLLPHWLMTELSNTCLFIVISLLAWFFAMWTELNLSVTSIFTWIFIVMKFVSSILFIILFYRNDLKRIMAERKIPFSYWGKSKNQVSPRSPRFRAVSESESTAPHNVSQVTAGDLTMHEKTLRKSYF